MSSRPENERTGLPNMRQPNLKTRVYELLLNMIIDGKYRDNDMLPPERILCEELGVSRTVIREAIKSLEARGVLQVIHGRGIKVVPITASDISDALMLYLRRRHRDVSMRDLMDLRYPVETEIAARAAQKAEPADLRALRETLERMGRAVRDVEGYIHTDMEFHLKLANITRNILFITVLESLLIPLHQTFAETFDEQDNERTFQEHARVSERVEAHDPEGARAAMRVHLEHTELALKGRGKIEGS